MTATRIRRIARQVKEFIFHFTGPADGGARMARQMKVVRLADLLSQCPGKWVAIKNDEIVAVRETPDQLVQDLHDRGIEDATIMCAPAETEPELVGLG